MLPSAAAQPALPPLIRIVVPFAAGASTDLMIGVNTTVAPQVKAGCARLVAVTTPQSAAVREVIEPDGSLPGALSPEVFGTRVRASYAAWKKLATEKNIVVLD